MKNQHRHIWILLILLLVILPPMLLSACGTGQTIPDLTRDAADEVTVQDVADTVASRTPMPTPIPNVLNQKISDFTEDHGLGEATFLGWTVMDWTNIAISVIIVIIGYFLGNKLVIKFANWAIRKISVNFDDTMLIKVKDELKWLVVIFSTRFAVLRLGLLGDLFRIAVDDILFILQLTFLTIIGIRLLDFSIQAYEDSMELKSDLLRLGPILSILKRLGNFLIIVVIVSIGLSHFGTNVNVLSVVLLSMGVILSLGAQDVISDVISGFIILLDQPFRVNDRIYIKELDTWGDVLQVGTRTTIIRTRDNREAIIPNSKIVNSEVVNYTKLGPSYRLQTELGVGYGSDIEKVRKVIKETVSGIDGVLKDKAVDVIFHKFGESARSIRVRFWIENYEKDKQILDLVNASLEIALDKANIDMPFNTFDLNVKLEDDRADQSAPSE